MEPKAEVSEAQFIIRPEKSEIGPDVDVTTEYNADHVMHPGETIDVIASVPQSYFSKEYSRISLSFTLRSRLQQSGLSLLYYKWEGDKFRFTLRNANSNSSISVPHDFSLGRFFVPGEKAGNESLKLLISDMQNNEAKIASNGESVIIPLKRFATVESPFIDLSLLSSDRQVLDSQLGLAWKTYMSPVKKNSLIIGETDVVQIPKGYIGRILRDESSATHEQSTLIDAGFKQTIRTEFWHHTSASAPQSFVRIELLRI